MRNSKRENIIFRCSLLAFVACLGLVSRLYFYDTNVFFFDGDEAVVALMGLDLLNGELPLYFYGQNYGLSVVEAAFIALGITIWGTTMLSIKIPMLLLWLISVYVWALIIEKILEDKRIWTFLFVALILLAPTWLVWSMKARGGYLPSFLLSTLIVYVLYVKQNGLNSLGWFFLAICLVVLFELQPLWFPATIPPVLFIAWKNWTSKRGRILLLGLLLSITGFKFIKSDADTIWPSPSIDILNLPSALLELPLSLMNSLRGNYYLAANYDTSNNYYAITVLILMILTIVVFLITNSKLFHPSWTFVFFLAMCFSLSGIALKPDSRYLLPFLTFFLLFVAQIFSDCSRKSFLRIIVLTMSLMLIAGTAYLPEFKDYSFINMEISTKEMKVQDDYRLMKRLYKKLEEEEIKYVLCANEFLQYQLNFMYPNKVLAVSKSERCRTPWNLSGVWEAILRDKKKFAIVGYNFGRKQPSEDQLIGGKIIYLPDADLTTATQLGFVKDAINFFENEK